MNDWIRIWQVIDVDVDVDVDVIWGMTIIQEIISGSPQRF